MAEKLATLTFTDGTPPVDFPVLTGSVGPDVIDVRALYAKTGKFTYDPGFMSTASCRSSITFIDGDKGILQYRGYPIEQLAEQCSFLEVAYLIMNGELPNKKQLDEFVGIVRRHTMVHEQLNRFYSGFRRDAHPMAVLCGVVGALSAFYHDSINIHDARNREISAFRLIAKLPTITAMTYKYNTGQPFMYPKNALSYVDNFLYMMFGTPCEEYRPNPVLSARHGAHPDPARGPRAERLDLDGAARRVDRRQPVRLHLGRHRQPVGAGPRRRQRGGAQDAGGDRRCEPNSRLHQARQGQGRPCHADGLRAPRLQELRSTRQDHPEDLPRGAGDAGSEGRQAVQAGDSAGAESRSRTNTSSNASSIPTWISTRASSTRRSASRSACSPPSSRWRAPWAGSPSGTS